ncbi:MAG TPA: hypothetical protein VF192_04340 [Longimicrobiales bacterium]
MEIRPSLRGPRHGGAPGAVLAALLLIAAGCDYDPNAPGRLGGGRGSPGGAVDMSGDWSYESELFLAGGGFSCSIEGMTLTLEQRDSTFSGSYSGATLICAGTGQPPDTMREVTGVVVGGRVRGDSVFFDIDDSRFRHAGRRSGTTVTGTAVMVLDDSHTLSGSFSAARQ